MEAHTTVIRHWEDVVFENRNKLYGAYSLRRAYSNRLLSGLGVTMVFIAIVVSLHNNRPPEETKALMPPILPERTVTLDAQPLIEREHRVIRRQPEQLARDLRNVVVTTAEVIEEEEVEVVENYISGDDFDFGEVGDPEGTGMVPAFVEPEPVKESPFVDFAEVMPHYEGGLEAMMKFIQKKIRYPRAPRQIGIEGTVYVRFVVNGDGSVSDVEVIKGVHPDYDKEAVRVISMLPAWKGGSHNGRPVGVRMVLPIKFNLQG